MVKHTSSSSSSSFLLAALSYKERPPSSLYFYRSTFALAPATGLKLRAHRTRSSSSSVFLFSPSQRTAQPPIKCIKCVEVYVGREARAQLPEKSVCARARAPIVTEREEPTSVLANKRVERRERRGVMQCCLFSRWREWGSSVDGRFGVVYSEGGMRGEKVTYTRFVQNSISL